MFQRSGKTTDKLLSEAYELSKFPNSRELDVLLSTGEQISISKLSILLNEMGYSSISLTGFQAGIYTNNVNQNAIIENIDISRIQKELAEKKIVIVAGFQGFNNNFDITTLGRGGSDTTAVALSAALNAKHCYIFSDVEGVYSADPNKINTAKKLDSISYTEMLDLSNEGAKVLHNRCIEIGEKFNIPIVAKSTFNNNAGSIIKTEIEGNFVKSIVKNDNMYLFHVEKVDNINNCSAEATTVKSGSCCKINYKFMKEFQEVYNTFIKNNILPVQAFNKSLYNKFDAYFVIPSADFYSSKSMFATELNSFSYTYKKVSKIAIIGYGITSTNITLEKVLSIVQEYNIQIFSADITGGKIILTFKSIVDDSLLERLHKDLIEKNYGAL